MAAIFPSGIVSTTQLPTRSDASAMGPNVHSNDHNQIRDELVAVETELGTNPKGTRASVKARLDVVDPPAKQTYQILNEGADDRTIDVNNTSVGELMNVIATLMKDLAANGQIIVT